MRHAFEREAQAAGRFAAAAALPAARLVAAGPPQGERVAIAALLQRLLDLHALWRLPDGDADYATRWSLFKSGFSRGLPAAKTRSVSKIAKREKGIWQRRYWEHAIRDDVDFEQHVNYIHYNPVKHGLVVRVADWPFSSFHRYVAQGILSGDWAGDATELSGRFGE